MPNEPSNRNQTYPPGYNPFAVLQSPNTSSSRTSSNNRTQQVNISRDTLFKKLWRNYPVNKSAPDTYKMVGGQAYALHKENPASYTNACALRLSRSLNYSGYRIKNRESGFYTVKGEDNFSYLLRVKEMIKLIKSKFGSPTSTFLSSNTSMASVSGKLSGKTGIIIFDVSGWSDATGHVTLWNGNTCGDSCYFVPHAPATTDRILFWEIK